MNIKLPAFITDLKMFHIFMLGIISGMPFSILYTTLIAWMKDYNLDLAIITTFAIARLPYSLKMFWSPVVDYFTVPFLAKFGRRKSWMLLSSFVIFTTLYAISKMTPGDNINAIRILAILIGFMAATYDISYDAMRIEMLNDNEQGLGAATAVLGYRLGALITGAGALYLSELYSWEQTIFFVAMLFLIAIIFTLCVKEQEAKKRIINESLSSKINNFVIMPFKDVMNRKGAILFLTAIVLYKMGEAMLAFVSLPFLMEIGYSKTQISVLAKSFGIIATIAGSFCGGIVIHRIGIVKGMISCGILQAITNLLYIWLHHQSIDNHHLMITVLADNFTGGMGSTALVAFISSLCNKQFTATQYALFTSLSTLMNNTLSTQTGTLINYIGWDYFFALTAILELPALVLLLCLGTRYFSKTDY